MNIKKVQIIVVLLNIVGWSIALGYLVFVAIPGPLDTPTIVMKVLFIIIVQALYAWFMWTHRTPKGFSFKIWRR